MEFAGKKMKVYTMLILAVLLLTMIPMFTPRINVNAQPTKIVILPVENNFNASTTPPGATFTVNVTVVDVTDLQNWQIKLTWDPELLNFSKISLPPDNVFAGAERSLITPPPDVGPGYVMYGCTYINDPYWTFNGTGTLCQVTLKILTPPSFPATCNLTLVNIGVDTFLLNGPGYDIEFTVEDATYTYTVTELRISIAPLGTYTNPIIVDYGGTQEFAASASGGLPPYTYQWFFQWPNGTEIEVSSAYNQTSWTCYPIMTPDRHKVTVQATDSLGLKANASSYIRFKSLSIELTPYPNTVVNVGQSKVFTATVSGGIPPYKIQWYRNDTEETSYANQTVATFTFSTAGFEYIKVKVTDSGGTTLEKTTGVTIFSTPTTIINVVSADGITTFYTNVTAVGDEITFNVTVVDVEDLQNWQIKLTWNPALLNLTDIWLPNDHVFSPIDIAINPSAPGARAMVYPSPVVGPGYVMWGCTYINDPYWTFNGTGTLCQVKLKIIRQPYAPQSSCVIGLVNQYDETFILNGIEYDIPFSIQNATYTYKLVSPVVHQLLGFTILTYTNTSIIANAIDYNIEGAWVKFLNITGAPGTAAYVNITLPQGLIWDSWKVYIDDVEVTPQIASDATNTYIYVEFTFGDNYNITIKVVGSGMVPEQTHMLLMALLFASLLAVAMSKTSFGKKFLKPSKIT
jgi:hypothetical protein